MDMPTTKYNAGQLAAELAVKLLIEDLANINRLGGEWDSIGENDRKHIAQRWEQIILRADDQIRARLRAEGLRAGIEEMRLRAAARALATTNQLRANECSDDQPALRAFLEQNAALFRRFAE